MFCFLSPLEFLFYFIFFNLTLQYCIGFAIYGFRSYIQILKLSQK